MQRLVDFQVLSFLLRVYSEVHSARPGTKFWLEQANGISDGMLAYEKTRRGRGWVVFNFFRCELTLINPPCTLCDGLLVYELNIHP
jgi:hypothetical protein